MKKVHRYTRTVIETDWSFDDPIKEEIQISNPSNILGYKVRNSKRWLASNFSDVKTHAEKFKLPWIDRNGNIMHSFHYVWNTQPENIISTIFATRIARVKGRMRRLQGDKFVNKHSDLITQLVLIGSFYSNNITNRLLFLIKDQRQRSIDMARCLCFKLDHSNRFVLCHALKNRRWFDMRWASKPSRRSKLDMLHLSRTIVDVSRLYQVECFEFNELNHYYASIYKSLHRISSNISMFYNIDFLNWKPVL
jgi:hypothetical protein